MASVASRWRRRATSLAVGVLLAVIVPAAGPPAEAYNFGTTVRQAVSPEQTVFDWTTTAVRGREHPGTHRPALSRTPRRAGPPDAVEQRESPDDRAHAWTTSHDGLRRDDVLARERGPRRLRRPRMDLTRPGRPTAPRSSRSCMTSTTVGSTRDKCIEPRFSPRTS